jgi:cytochrome P450
MLRLLQWLVRQDWLLRLLAPAIGLFNPFLSENRRDPYPSYARVREAGGIYRAPFGMFVASRYDDVVALLRDPRFSADRSQAAPFRLIRWLNRDAPDFLNLIDRNLLNLDGPDHARIRGLVTKAFTPRRVAALRPRIEAIVETLLDEAGERPDFELVRDLAHPLPVIVVAELLGVPLEDRERFRGWSSGVVQIIDPLNAERGLGRAREAASALAGYFRGMLALRRAEPRDDLLSAMIAAEQDGRVLGEGDLLSLCALLLAAGHETTTNLISNAVLALLRFPDQAERLRAQPSLMPTAVEEFLRFDSPVQFTDRSAFRAGDRWGSCWRPRTTTPRSSRRRIASTSGARTTATSRSEGARTSASVRPSRGSRRSSRSAPCCAVSRSGAATRARWRTGVRCCCAARSRSRCGSSAHCAVRARERNRSTTRGLLLPTRWTGATSRGASESALPTRAP